MHPGRNANHHVTPPPSPPHEAQRDTLMNIRDEVADRFYDLLDDDEFDETFSEYIVRAVGR